MLNWKKTPITIEQCSLMQTVQTLTVNWSTHSALLIEPSSLKCNGIQYCGVWPFRPSGACCHLQQTNTREHYSKKRSLIPVSCPYIWCAALSIGHFDDIVLLRSSDRGGACITILTSLSWCWNSTHAIIVTNVDVCLFHWHTPDISARLKRQIFLLKIPKDSKNKILYEPAEYKDLMANQHDRQESHFLAYRNGNTSHTVHNKSHLL